MPVPDLTLGFCNTDAGFNLGFLQIADASVVRICAEQFKIFLSCNFDIGLAAPTQINRPTQFIHQRRGVRLNFVNKPRPYTFAVY